MVSSASTGRSSKSRERCVVQDGDSVWIQGEYTKDKLRIRERYWRDASEILNSTTLAAAPASLSSETKESNQDQKFLFIIPDAIVWYVRRRKPQ